MKVLLLLLTNKKILGKKTSNNEHFNVCLFYKSL